MTRPHYMENRIRETLKAFVPGDTFTVFKIQQEAAKDARPYVPGTSTVSGLLRSLAAAGTLEKIPGTRGEYRHIAASAPIPVPQAPILEEPVRVYAFKVGDLVSGKNCIGWEVTGCVECVDEEDLKLPYLVRDSNGGGHWCMEIDLTPAPVAETVSAPADLMARLEAKADLILERLDTLRDLEIRIVDGVLALLDQGAK